MELTENSSVETFTSHLGSYELRRRLAPNKQIPSKLIHRNADGERLLSTEHRQKT